MKTLIASILCVSAAFSLPAAAQHYPSGAVRLVVPYPPGGGVDGMARPMAERLSKAWGKPVLVDNRPGAATIIGTDAVAKSQPDGLTLLFTTDSSITSNPHLYAKLPFDPLRDLEPVTQLVDLPMIVTVHPSVKAQSMKELVEIARAQPDKLNYASFGDGSQPNLLFETLKIQTGVKISQIPYKGVAPVLQAMLAGETEMTLGGAPWQNHFEAGKLKAIAIDRSQRLPQLPNVPTLAEAGFPDLTLRSWFGVFAPKGTPKPILEKIRADMLAILNEPQFAAKDIAGFGYTGVGSTPDDFKNFVRSDFAYKEKMIKAIGIKLN